MKFKFISYIICSLIIALHFACSGVKQKKIDTSMDIKNENILTTLLTEHNNTKKSLSQTDKPKVLANPALETEEDHSEEFEEIALLREEKSKEKSAPIEKESSGTLKTGENALKDSKIQVEEPQKSSGNIFNIYIRDADIRSVILSLSKQSKYSFILDPNVQGNVTMDLKEVTIQKALNEILASHGYTYDMKGDFIRIYKPKRETKIFRLNYLPTIREGTTTVEANAPGGVDKEEKTPTVVINKESTDLWAEIENGLKGIVSKAGTFSINKLASLIIVTDYSDNLEKIAELLETVEGTIQRQVLIEATVIEVTLSDNYETGINWTHIIGNEQKSRYAIFSQSSPDILSSSVFSFYFKYPNFETLIKALSQQGKINIISKPRITTLNNQKAIIKVGTEEVYFEYERRWEEYAGEAQAQLVNVWTPQFFTVGLVLDVTPQIGSSDEITLHIHPLFSEKKEDKDVPTGGGTVPIVTIRESSSVVKIKSGQTIVLAGLMMEKNTNKTNGVPVLQNIPFIGNLFKHNYIAKENTELVVTLTPKIMYGNEIDNFSDKELERILDIK